MENGKKKINILFVLPNFDTGGSEKLVFDIIRHIDKSKFSPVLCVFFTGKLEEEFLKLGVPFYVIHRDRVLSKWQTARFISDIVRRHHIEVVNTHHTSPLIQGLIPFKILNRVLWIHTEHLPLAFDPNVTPKMVLLTKIWLKFVDTVVGISQGVCDYFRDDLNVPERKIVKILNGIDVAVFQSLKPDTRCQMRDALGIAQEDIVIGMFANFRKQKNHGLLLRAVKLLKDRGINNIKVVLAGDGPERENIERMIQDLCLVSCVMCLGMRHDIPDLMNAIDIYCLPSHFEGLPFSLIEAFASGKQVVATDVPGNRDVVQEMGQGILVESDNPEKLAEALVDILKGAPVPQCPSAPAISGEPGNRGTGELVSFPFSSDEMLAKYEQLFNGVHS